MGGLSIDFEGVSFEVPRAALAGWAVRGGRLFLHLKDFSGTLKVSPANSGSSSSSNGTSQVVRSTPVSSTGAPRSKARLTANMRQSRSSSLDTATATSNAKGQQSEDPNKLAQKPLFAKSPGARVGSRLNGHHRGFVPPRKRTKLVTPSQPPHVVQDAAQVSKEGSGVPGRDSTMKIPALSATPKAKQPHRDVIVIDESSPSPQASPMEPKPLHRRLVTSDAAPTSSDAAVLERGIKPHVPHSDVAPSSKDATRCGRPATGTPTLRASNLSLDFFRPRKRQQSVLHCALTPGHREDKELLPNNLRTAEITENRKARSAVVRGVDTSTPSNCTSSRCDEVDNDVEDKVTSCNNSTRQEASPSSAPSLPDQVQVLPLPTVATVSSHSFVTARSARPRRPRLTKSARGVVRDFMPFDLAGAAQSRTGRAETISIASNKPCEDFYRSCKIPIPGEDVPMVLSMICDGHGGIRAAKFACTQLPEILSKLAVASIPEGDRRKAALQAMLVKSIELCEELFRESIASEDRLKRGYCNAGACVVAVLVLGADVAFANIGDSRGIASVMRQMAVPEDDASLTSSNRFVELKTKQITYDHIASDLSEAARIRQQTGDPEAIQAAAGEGGTARVKGSLAVTRSFGDLYLKQSEFCRDSELIPRLPYLLSGVFGSSTSLCHSGGASKNCGSEGGSEMDEQSFIVIASDGLWDHLSNFEVSECIAKHIAQNGDAESGLEVERATGALLYQLLQTIGVKRGKSVSQLLQVPQGERRPLFDDITITVLFLDGVLCL
eukprot:INCI8298.1.p1 GENE.INCI8298.1~~INCI8298.1.p1  ORF type:complete len:846 (-),score=119.15 INCI8298.1:1465-3807(-)